MIVRKTLLIVAIALAGSGCSVAGEGGGPAGAEEHPGRVRTAPYVPDPAGVEKGDVPMPKSQRPPQIVSERACGAFDALEELAHQIIAPPPHGPVSERPAGELIAVASALNAVDRTDVSPAMNAAIRAHAVALTNLGALVNHKASREDIESMATVTIATGSTLHALCQE